MGSITSPLDGETKFIGETITIAYDSGAFNFGNGTGEIDSLQYVLDGIPKATKIMQPATAPAQHSYTLALPLSAGATTIQVHARNANTMVLETVTITLNLIARPSATCTGADNQALDALDFTGNLAGIPAGGSARFRYGTVSGGPYPDTVAAAPYADGPVTGPVTGLSAGTVYYYVLEILDASATVVATSPQCSGQTLLDANQAGPACPVPPFVDDCPPKQVYTVGGVDYIAYQFCDKATNTPILVVYKLCDGEPSGTPTYYDLLGQPYTPAGVVGLCDTGLDYETLCDKGTDPNTRILALWDTSTVPPTLKYYTPGIDGSLVAYTPIGPVGACPETDTEESQICYLAINDGTGYAAGDQLLQILFWDTGENPPTLTATVWRNQTQNTTLTAAPILTDLSSCDAADHEFEVFCDDNGPFLRRYSTDANGNVVSKDTALNGTTAYAPVGTVKTCSPSFVTTSSFCFYSIFDQTGVAATERLTQLTTWDHSTDPPTLLSMIWFNQTTGAILTAALDQEQLRPCDMEFSEQHYCYKAVTDSPWWHIGDTLLRSIVRDFSFYFHSNALPISDMYFNVTTGIEIPYGVTSPVVGTDVVECVSPDEEILILCDNNGPFLRRYTITDGAVTIADTALDGSTVYTPVGTVETCAGDMTYVDCGGPGDTTCTATVVGGTVTYHDSSDPDMQITVTTAVGGNRTIDLHFSPLPAAGNLDANLEAWIGDLDAALQTGDLVMLRITGGDDTTFPKVFALRGARSVSYVSSDLDNDDFHLTIVDDLDVDDTCAGLNEFYDMERTAVAESFHVQDANFTRYQSEDITTPGTDVQSALLVSVCGDAAAQYESICLQDSTNTQFVRIVKIDPSSGLVEVLGNYATDFLSTYTPVGAVAACDTGDQEVEVITLCDDSGAFLRHIVYSTDQSIDRTYDTALDGSTAYTAVGTIKTCQPEGKPCLTCRS